MGRRRENGVGGGRRGAIAGVAATLLVAAAPAAGASERPHRVFGLEDGLLTPETTSFFQDESGATAIEYGLIAALIAVVIIAAVTALGTKVSSTFDTIEGSMP